MKGSRSLIAGSDIDWRRFGVCTAPTDAAADPDALTHCKTVGELSRDLKSQLGEVAGDAEQCIEYKKNLNAVRAAEEVLEGPIESMRRARVNWPGRSASVAGPTRQALLDATKALQPEEWAIVRRGRLDLTIDDCKKPALAEANSNVRQWKELGSADRAAQLLAACGVQDLFGAGVVKQVKVLLDIEDVAATVPRASLRRPTRGKLQLLECINTEPKLRGPGVQVLGQRR